MLLAHSSLGIDITNHKVRVAWLKKAKQRIYVFNLVEENIEDFLDEQVFIKIKHKLKKFGTLPVFLPKNQIIAVPQSQVAIKQFSLTPNLSEPEQYMQIGMQLSEKLGLPFDELLFDFHPLPDGSHARAFACRHSLLADNLNMLTNAGFSPSVLELQSQSLLRLYQHKMLEQPRDIAVLVEVNTERIQLLACYRQAEPFYRELPLYHSLPQSATEFELTDQLCEQLLKQYQQINTHFAHVGIGKLLLCGEAVDWIDKQQLSDKLGWQVSCLDPFKSVHYADKKSLAAEKWATAVGLALRGL